MPSVILGISAYYHDSAAALLVDGDLIAAAQEERFTRKKHDQSFPLQAIQYCLEEASIGLKNVDYIVFYDKPLIKFERLLETYLSYAPRGFLSFLSAMPVWLKEKLFLKDTMRKELSKISGLKKCELPPLMFTEHHQSHAASAFYPSPFDTAAILCVDGVGEWTTTSVWLGNGNKMTPQWEIKFPHSLGLLYSAFTFFAGFKVNSGEYKLMGLAPYGQPRFVDLIYKHLLKRKSDGSFSLDMKYFNFATGLTMTNKHFDELFGGKPRQAESPIGQREMDLAASIQVVIEEMIILISKEIKEKLKVDHLCLAGGVALNCVANGKLLKQNIFKDIWIQPAAGDAGGAVGSAYAIWHEYLENPRVSDNTNDKMQGAYLGPSHTDEDIRSYLDSIGAPYETLPDDILFSQTAELLSESNVIGWFQGRMEFGPRALGARSIIGDPRDPKMQSIMNLKIKYRESFRPFAPSVKCEKASEWFNFKKNSPYMLLVAKIHESKLLNQERKENVSGIDLLKIPRSTIPAITHVDNTARLQTVSKTSNPRYWALLDAFEVKTETPILINTSFNVRGEPIVCTPADAYRCFMRTEMDYLVIGNIFLKKSLQPYLKETESWKDEFDLD